MPFHPPAQVRARGAAFLADGADELPARHVVARPHVHPLQVQIGADQALPVVDEDQRALEMQVALGEGHHPRRRRPRHPHHQVILRWKITR